MIGYIYILFNPAFGADLYKVGKTIRSPVGRARELSSATGVPEPFKVLYDEHVTDCHRAEAIVHAKLHPSRTRSGKEFFAVDFKEILLAVQEAADEVGRVETAAVPPGITRLN